MIEDVKVSNLSKIDTIRSCSSLEGTGIIVFPNPFALIAEIFPDELFTGDGTAQGHLTLTKPDNLPVTPPVRAFDTYFLT